MKNTIRSLPLAGLAFLAAGAAAGQLAPSEPTTPPPDAAARPPASPAPPAPAIQPAPVPAPPVAPRSDTPLLLPEATQPTAPDAPPAPPPTSPPRSLPPAPAVASPSSAPVCCPAPKEADVWTAKDWAAIIGSIAGLLAFFVGLGAIWSNLRSTRNNNNQKTNEAELKSIEEKLDEFFGPYLQLSNTNKLIADELKRRHTEAPEMRILLLLLEPGWRKNMSRGDATLIDEIIGIDKSLLALIQDKAGMVDSAVQPYLYRAAAHFRMMLRAHEGLLDNEPATYRSYVYPRQLDRVIQLEVDRLKARISLLRSSPMEQHPPMAPLAIPADLALDEWPPADDPNPGA